MRKKLPWCIEVEYNVSDEGNDKLSDFFVVKRVVADVKDLHLLVVREGGEGEKISIDRRTISKVMMVNSTKDA